MFSGDIENIVIKWFNEVLSDWKKFFFLVLLFVEQTAVIT